MNVNEIITLLFNENQETMRWRELIEMILTETGLNDFLVKKYISECKSEMTTLDSFIVCVNKKLGLEPEPEPNSTPQP